MDQEPSPTPRRHSRLFGWFRDHTHADWGSDPSQFDEAYLNRILNRIRPMYGRRGWMPATAAGFEEIPDAPCLVVLNHSGGSSTPDAWGFVYAWYRHFGTERPLHVLAHEFILANPFSGPMLSRMGVVTADPDRALDVLTRQRQDLLVLPGGDAEAWRPYRDRYRLSFGEHRGYARLALQAQVPIVPVAHAGAHETLVVMTDGRGIAQRLRLHELFRIDVFPIHLSFPWLLGIGPLPHLPVPMKLRYRIGPALPPTPLPDPSSEPPDVLIRAQDALVRDAIQRQLDGLAAELR